MSATSRISRLGSLSAVSIIWSAQELAKSRLYLSIATRTATRRRFSISASRSMIGIAHSSPSFSAVTCW